MGIDGMNSADIFDEYFDNKKPKCIIKDCTNCQYFEIETFYGVCDKYGILNGVIKDCKDFEESNNDLENNRLQR